MTELSHKNEKNGGEEMATADSEFKELKVTYIYHSSFVVETERVQLLFDYFKGDLECLNPKKPLYVFASHRHGDHFSEKIFELSRKIDCVYYVLSADIWKKRVPEELRERTVFLKPYEERRIGEIHVKTLQSTDVGVAFLVEADGHRIYHAGDLNDWTWEGEPEEDNRKMRKRYRKEIDSLAGTDLDAAFVVLDGRQEAEYRDGMDYFLEKVGAKRVYPMHCWDNYGIIREYMEQRKREGKDDGNLCLIH